MRDVWRWRIAALAVAAIGASAAPWPAPDFLRVAVADALRNRGGLTFDAADGVSLILAPSPRLTLTQVALRDESGRIAITAPRLSATLALWSLLAGRVEISAVALRQPNIRVEVGSTSARDALAVAGALLRDAEGGRADFVVDDGEITILRERLATAVELDHVNLALSWSGFDAAGEARCAFDWRGERTRVAFWLGAPAALRQSGSSPLSVQIDDADGFLRVDGSVRADQPGFVGQIEGSATSLRTLEPELARSPWIQDVAPLRLASALRVDPSGVALSDLRLSMGQTELDGVVNVDLAGARPNVVGTLAADEVDLTRYVARWIQSGRDAAARMEEAGLDADVRLSAGRARLGAVDMQDAGFDLMLSEEGLDLSLIEAQAFGGAVKGRLSARWKENGPAFTAAGSLTQVDLAAMTTQATGEPRLGGRGDGEFTLAAENLDWLTLLQSLRGSAALRAEQGFVSGVDFEEALRRQEKRPSATLPDMRPGRTMFDEGHVSLTIQNGVARIDDAWARAAGGAFVARGSADLAQRTLGVTVDANASASANALQPEPRITMQVEGEWDRPTIRVQSGASP